MNDLILAHSGGVTFASFGTDWLYLGIPVLGLVAVSTWLFATGTRSDRAGLPGLVERIGSSLERVSGLPAWSAAGIGMGLWALLVAAIGFLWDVAWHMDLGRDEFLLTPSHTMILVGLGSIIVAGAISTMFATQQRAAVGVKLGRWTIPYGALGLLALGFGSISGFPLDELWHRSYGVDVTMWGPTHLVMIAGASFTPLALWILLAEAPDVDSAVERRIKRTLAGVVVVGLSTFQAEFDFGTPQFQQLYHPVLIAAASGIGLTLARAALGAGGALIAVLGFLATRSALAILIGPVLGHTVPRFPLYLAAAAVVELGAWLGEKYGNLHQAVLTGALVGTVGVGGEWIWMQVWGRHPWGQNLFPGVLIALGVAVAAVVLGTAMGRILRRETPGVPARIIGIAGVALVVGLALPLPRQAAPYEARMSTEPAGDGAVNVEIAMTPTTAADRVDWFNILSWQGGRVILTPLVGTGPGTYRSASPIPADGDWKSMVRLADKDILVATPVYMPADPQIGASEIPVRPTQQVEFLRDTEFLMREAHAGPAWPSLVAYGSILVLATGWASVFTLAFIRLSQRRPATSAGTSKRVVRRSAAVGV